MSGVGARGGEASQFRNSGAVAQEFGKCSEKKRRKKRTSTFFQRTSSPYFKTCWHWAGCGHSPRGATNNAGQGWLLWHHTPPFSSESGEGLAARGRDGQWGERGREGRWPTSKTAAVLEKEGREGSIYCLYVASPAHPWNFQREEEATNLGRRKRALVPIRPQRVGREGEQSVLACLNPKRLEGDRVKRRKRRKAARLSHLQSPRSFL